ncbi:MAG TPA: fluoride efflux transporter CrcB [Ilumatobacteraceae bacterium]|nr:fluoride efflux transporter CrcB [Ilumatobacteraceae bacterium]
MTPLAWAVFLAAAAIGAPSRYLLDGWVQDRTRGAFPWGTFTVNVSGCLLLGLLTGLGLYHDLDSTIRTVLGAGGLGAYTTFSTFTFETIRLAEEDALDEAFRNAAASVLVGLAAASAGLALTAL